MAVKFDPAKELQGTGVIWPYYGTYYGYGHP